MVELLTSMQHMLEQARVRTQGVGSLQDLHQLVIIVADGRFHEKESLQRVVAVRKHVNALLLAAQVSVNALLLLHTSECLSLAISCRRCLSQRVHIRRAC